MLWAGPDAVRFQPIDFYLPRRIRVPYPNLHNTQSSDFTVPLCVVPLAMCLKAHAVLGWSGMLSSIASHTNQRRGQSKYEQL